MATTRNSAQWVYLRLLAYLGVTNLNAPPVANASDPLSEPGNAQYVTEGLDEDCAGIITASIQEIFDAAPASISEMPQGGSLFAPASITLTVTPGSATATVGGGLLPWMNGCSIMVTGDGYVNEIAVSSPFPTPVNGGGNAITLRRPYLGVSSGSVAAVVLGNAIVLDSSIKNVLEPVEVAGTLGPLIQLEAFGSRAEFDYYSGCHFRSLSVIPGWPIAYFVEAAYNPALNYLPLVLRVAHAPTQAMPITFRAKLNPPKVTAADLGTASADPGKMLPIPGQWVESVLLPMCLQRLTGHPLFKNEAAKAEIARQFQAAKSMLLGFQPQAKVETSYR